MKIEEKDQHTVQKRGSNSEFNPKVAFLQVPVKIKDQVKDFIDSLVDESGAEKPELQDTLAPFQSQGCFFVIALERIDEINGYLKKALDPQENDIDVIRAEIQKALIALQGQ